MPSNAPFRTILRSRLCGDAANEEGYWCEEQGAFLFFWLTISDIYIHYPDSAKITFANPSDISKSLPASAFQLQDDDEDEEGFSD